MTCQLENEHILLAVDYETGAICKLLNKKTGWELIEQPALAMGLSMIVPCEKYENNHAYSERQKVSSIETEEDRMTIVWPSVFTDKMGELPISVTAEIKLSGKLLTFSLSISNQSPYPVQEVYFPCLGGLRDRPGERLKGLLTDRYGGLYSIKVSEHAANNLGYWGTDYPSYLARYPSHDLAAPFELMQRGNQGFYLGASLGETPELTCFLNEFRPGFADAIAETVPDGDTLNGYPAGTVLSVIRLPFLAPGAEMSLHPVEFRFYEGGWEQGVRLYRQQLAEQKTALRPDWFHTLDSFVSVDLGERGLSADDLPRLAEEAQAAGLSGLFCRSFTGSAAERKAIDAIHGLGMRILFDLDLHLVNSFHEPEVCKLDEAFLSSLQEKIRRMAGAGVDGIVLNSNSHTPACIDRKGLHHHPIGKLFIEGLLESLLPLAEELAQKDVLLADRNLFVGLRPLVSLGIPEGHDCGIRYLTGTPMLPAVDPESGLAISCAGIDDRRLIRYAILYHHRINISPMYGKGDLSEVPGTVCYAKEMLSLRRRLAGWLWDGTYLGEDGGMTIEAEDIRYAFYRNEENGRLALVMCNETDREVTAALTDPLGRSWQPEGAESGSISGNRATLPPHTLSIFIEE